MGPSLTLEEEHGLAETLEPWVSSHLRLSLGWSQVLLHLVISGLCSVRWCKSFDALKVFSVLKFIYNTCPDGFFSPSFEVVRNTLNPESIIT